MNSFENELVVSIVGPYQEKLNRIGFACFNKLFWVSKVGNEFVIKNWKSKDDLKKMSDVKWEKECERCLELAEAEMVDERMLQVLGFLGARYKDKIRGLIVRVLQHKNPGLRTQKDRNRYVWLPDQVEIVPILNISQFIMKAVMEEGKYFRGQPNAAYEVIPSVHRLNPGITEKSLFYKPMTDRPREFSGCKTTFECLVKMQHYRIPTRLVDITENPLIALFFGCEGGKDTGTIGCVYEYTGLESRMFDGDTAMMISNLARMDDEFEMRELEWKIKQENPNFSFKDFDPVKELNQAVVVKPKRENERIILQRGLFILCGEVMKMAPSRKYRKSGASQMLHEIHKRHKIYIFDWTYKNSILKGLDGIGIDRSYIYPEIEYYAEKIKKAAT